jgi:hypothetical protein
MRTERCGLYLIHAGAAALPGRKWQPRLTMERATSPSEPPSRQQAFPGLPGAFDTSDAATRYALDLGRELARERSSRLRV